MKYNRLIAFVALIISAVIFLYTLISFSNKTYPMVGHDFAYFLPRLLDSYLHYKVNGLSIQWYTPSFGGGIPAYPNPQHMQFTLSALLTLFVEPWNAVWIANTIYISLGFVFAYLFFEQILVLDPLASAIGSIIFNVNGFVFSHAIVGHLGYQLFPLIPAVLWGLFHPRMNYYNKSIVISLVVFLNIHGGGFYIIVIYLLSIITSIPIIILQQPRVFSLKNLGTVSLLAGLFVFLTCGSKIFAVSAFMEWFPREVNNYQPVSLLVGLDRVRYQLFGLTSLILIGKYRNSAGLANYIEQSLISRSSGYGLWEFDTSISLASLVICLSFAALCIFSRRSNKTTKKAFLLLILTLFGFWLTTEFRITTGFIYPLLHKLPGFKSLHLNMRYASAYIFPLSMISAIGFNAFKAKLKPALYISAAFIFVFISLAPLRAYSLIAADQYQFGYNVSMASRDYRNLKNAASFSINSIGDWDGNVFQNRASSLKPYEPIFGYYREYFHPLTSLGSVYETNNGYFNFTNPASLVYPEENNLFLFERIKISEYDKLEKIINYKQPDWKRPKIQYLLDGLMLMSIILLPLIVTFNFINQKLTTKKPVLTN